MQDRRRRRRLQSLGFQPWSRCWAVAACNIREDGQQRRNHQQGGGWEVYNCITREGGRWAPPMRLPPSQCGTLLCSGGDTYLSTHRSCPGGKRRSSLAGCVRRSRTSFARDARPRSKPLMLVIICLMVLASATSCTKSEKEWTPIRGTTSLPEEWEGCQGYSSFWPGMPERLVLLRT